MLARRPALEIDAMKLMLYRAMGTPLLSILDV